MPAPPLTYARALQLLRFVSPCKPLGDAYILLSRSQRLGIFPTFYRLFEPLFGVSVPKEFEQAFLHHIAATRFLLHSMERIGELTQGKRYIQLKGTALSRRFFHHPYYRESTDIDLWVTEADREEAEALLCTLGYIAHEDLDPEAHNQCAYYHPQGYAPVELHWRLSAAPLPQITFLDAWETRGLVEDSSPFSVLSDHHTYAHLLLHALQHWGALKPLLDLALFWDSSEDVDRGALESVCRDLGILRLHYFYLHCLKQAGCSLPFPIPPHAILEKLSKRYVERFSSLLCAPTPWQETARLVWGEDVTHEKIHGTLQRSLSMFLLDGYVRPVRSSLQVLFQGPHRLGRFIRKLPSYRFFP